MRNTIIVLFLSLLAWGYSYGQAASTGSTTTPDPTFSGRYSHENIVFEFKGDRCFGYFDGELMSESTFYVKGDKLYISPNLPDIADMIRKVYCVYSIKDEVITSLYIEDAETGEKFEEHLAGQITLKKEHPNQ